MPAGRPWGHASERRPRKQRVFPALVSGGPLCVDGGRDCSGREIGRTQPQASIVSRQSSRIARPRPAGGCRQSPGARQTASRRAGSQEQSERTFPAAHAGWHGCGLVEPTVPRETSRPRRGCGGFRPGRDGTGRPSIRGSSHARRSVQVFPILRDRLMGEDYRVFAATFACSTAR